MAIDINPILSLLADNRKITLLNGKQPVTKDWPTKDVSLEEIKNHIKNGGNVGYRLEGLLVIDVDPKNGGDVDAVVAAFDIDQSVSVETGRGNGGCHICLALPEGVEANDLRMKLPEFEGVEFKSGNKHQVVAPGSLHPEPVQGTDGVYKWDELWCSGWPVGGPSEAPEELISALLKAKLSPKTTEEPKGHNIDPEKLSEMLAALDVEDYRDQSDWLALMMACHEATGGMGRDEFIAWSTGDPLYQEAADEVGVRWDSLNADTKGGVTYRTLFKKVSEAGRVDLLPRRSAVSDFAGDTVDAEMLPQSSIDFSEEESGFGTEMQFNQRGDSALNNHNNAICAVAKLGLLPAVNEAFDEITLRGNGPVIWKHGRSLSDNLVTAIRTEICRANAVHRYQPTNQQVIEAIHALAVENRFNPVVEYLDALCWDGTERLDNLPNYFNAENTELSRACLRKTLIASVRRQRTPGCKHDTMVVLLSDKQGLGKSTAIRKLYGDEAFSDAPLGDLNGKDAPMVLARHWAVEMAELDALRQAETTTLKGFLSRQTDDFRRPYGSVVEKRPRRCVIWGTGNERGFLRDETGNRRFWPITVNGPIDTAALEEIRDQLWAEAAHLEAMDESNELPEELWETASERQAVELTSDPWEDMLADHMADRMELAKEDSDFQNDRVKIVELYVVVGAERRPNKTDKTRIVRAMRKLGWEESKSAMRFSDGDKARAFRRVA